MTPVKIKAYGLLPISKSVFLGIQAFGFSILVTALVVFVMTPPATDSIRVVIDPDLNGRNAEQSAAPFALLFIKLIAYAPWIILAGIALGVVETVVMLRKYRKKEEELRKQGERRAKS